MNNQLEGWPQEFKEKLILGNLESNVGIATLWTQRDIVAKNIDKEKYAIIGQYYDRQNGLEPLVRNCLANPNIRYILIVGNDMSKSKRVLINFFEKGFEDGKVVGTDTTIPKAIPQEELEKLRDNIKVIDLTDKIENLNNSDEYKRVIEERIDKLEKLEPYAEPKLFEKPDFTSDMFPSENVGFVVRDDYIGSAWIKILKTIYDYGTITHLRSNDSTNVRECVNLVAIISKEDPQNPKIEEYYKNSKEYIFLYYDEMCTPKLPKGVAYTYGSRFRAWKDRVTGKTIDQIEEMVEYLKGDIYRKSAYAHTWIVEESMVRRTKGSPCVISVQPNIQDGVLHLTSYIRSNDMFRGWILNAYGLRNLQKIICDRLGVQMGTLTTISNSAHIYEDNFEETKRLVEKYYKSANCFYDLRGYYMIDTQEDKIRVTHYSPDSQKLKEYLGKSAREINDKINSSQHPIDSYHSSYLGEELQKAEIAIKLGIGYEQDKELEV